MCNQTQMNDDENAVAASVDRLAPPTLWQGEQTTLCLSKFWLTSRTMEAANNEHLIHRIFKYGRESVLNRPAIRKYENASKCMKIRLFFNRLSPRRKYSPQ